MTSNTGTLSTLNIDPGTVIDGRFEVVDRIGSGGMGIVLRVIDREIHNEVVALKLLHPHLAADGTIFKRFRTEVLIARTLTHPNIVRIHDMGKTEDGYSYISMEYVDGVSLKDRLTEAANSPAQIGRLHFDEVVSYLLQTCAGVAYAHGKGVIHRDLKPPNILMSKSGEVKLADFGTARILGMDTSLTQTGQAIGTPDYMSPEQIRGEQLDAACDIYALGIIAFELATGRKPFTADSAVAIAFKHLNEPLPDFGTAAGYVPEWFQDLARKAAAKNKADRFNSAREMVRAIALHASHPAAEEILETVDSTHFASSRAAERTVSAHATSTVSEELRFELGSGSDTADDEGWNLEGSARSTGTRKAASPIARPPKQNVPVLAMTFVVALVVGAYFYGRDPESFHQLFAAKEKKVALTTAEVPNDVPSVPPELGESSEKQVEDLLAFNTEGKSGESSSSSGTAQQAVAVREPETPAKVETAKIDSASKVETTPKAEPSVKTEPVKPTQPAELPLGPLTSELAVTENHNPLHGSVDLAKFSSAGWKATVSGFRNDKEIEKNRDQLLKDFYVNVFVPDTSQVVARLSPASLSVENGHAILEGSLASVSTDSLKPGEYRLDLIKKGEHLISAPLPVHRATVTLGPQQVVQTPATQQPVTIVTGATVIDPNAEKENKPTQVASNSNSSLATTENASPIVPPVRIQSNTDSNQQSSSLPPAKRGPGEKPISVPVEVQEPVAVEQPVGVEEKYTGSWISGGGAAETKQSMTLDLTIANDEVTGSAEINSIGSFSVSGRILPRGLELILRGDATSFRLSGRRKGQSLRGSFFTADGQGGSWQVDRL